ncbi:C4-dicarboxylate ABC transporter substrate-binding protein [Halobacillus halophilus]|uniref:TRAP-T type transporter solute receptor n=1 Tax=Halobacillus halophilus (strain ATCC 35676 / DSM 2266 / JCM 20832 / KCTC 3685 / LMG 17431 / NBRC 102448 / NCIMB 2269) TaxID=866895 RepID=I0JQW2_HALH3|nr:TAXI family TRAP transporter solute-binding subunit [Halobacillus halophilus]ASF40534.1 C4-dicarboxylate ABC transporter substrate-binding protein [Halobacillus halophilus]CCG46532.1 putative TRAP-T type transporter solute receptor [Halobacillus halophilus DSM 2266]
MLKKLVFLIALASVMVLAACGGDGGSEGASGSGGSDSKSIVLGTGGTSGTYYPIGGALKPVFEESDSIDNVTVESTGASVANIQNIQDQLNQMAIIMSDVGYDAIEGNGQFEGNSVDVQAMAGMYQNVVQVVALKDSGIQSIEDLKGKKVGVGKVGSGVEQSAKKVLEAVGLTYDDFSKVTHTGYADSVQEMKNGNLDAAFFTSGVPNSNITDLQQQTDINFVEIKGETAKKLMDKYPFYKANKIEAGNEAKYKLENPVETVGIQNMIIVSPDLSEDVVYDLTKRYYEYLGTEGVSVGALKQLGRDEIAKDLVAPLHPGAKKFYEEQGILE